MTVVPSISSEPARSDSEKDSTDPDSASGEHPSQTPQTHKVQFEIKNVSGFSLRNPVLTFRVPLPRGYKDGEPLTFNSNLFNSQEELRLLKFGDTLVLSNRNLPYWNHDEAITIWIRMALDRMPDVFRVKVSLNSDNAEGATKNVSIEPAKLLGS